MCSTSGRVQWYAEKYQQVTEIASALRLCTNPGRKTKCRERSRCRSGQGRADCRQQHPPNWAQTLCTVLSGCVEQLYFSWAAASTLITAWLVVSSPTAFSGDCGKMKSLKWLFFFFFQAWLHLQRASLWEKRSLSLSPDQRYRITQSLRRTCSFSVWSPPDSQSSLSPVWRCRAPWTAVWYSRPAHGSNRLFRRCAENFRNSCFFLNKGTK